MKIARSSLFCIFVVIVCPTKSSFLRKTIPAKVPTNRIAEITTRCDSQNINVTVSTKQPFKGAVFARDFAQECKVFGTLSHSASLSLPTSGCGVRLTSSPEENGRARMTYSVVLVLQQDRYLRQISDQERFVRCEVPDEAFLVRSQSLFKALKEDIKDQKTNHRVGRLMNEGWSKDLSQDELEEELREAMSAARAWMEIVPENNLERPLGTVEVGETLLLTVKATLPAGIGWRMVDCSAHDGLGDSSQKLLDELGCPVDEALLPTPKFGPIKPIASMRHQEATAKFAAFKFPDRNRLHLKCKLQICRGVCNKVECEGENSTDARVGRSNFNLSDAILDRLEVYNSVEVIAPEIDDANEFRKKMNSADFDSYPFPKIPGDRTFCVSVDKMAIAFCILGLIFLIAIMVATCSLLKSRRSHDGMQYYTRSLFSSSSSGSAFGSKLLLEESPVLGQSASTMSNRMHYGRIL
ncbi:uncharacterized protein LOC126735088 [Anthonomus grandis grandis]|uniref:uncharacterized protein LOC126735088 n=1 Tax=Anthonomus grandis grandis TaxID=2921223 RepID=UPI0021659A90|nr:uncharacterized protein LOC126735088 [Anthonomus grandis grandis]